MVVIFIPVRPVRRPGEGPPLPPPPPPPPHLLLLLLSLQHLPHEFKLLYHNETIDHPHLSNCNLPSLCAKCRTRDGLQRPVADLMASIPCGFCRCGSDLHHPPYITLPKEVSWSSRESLDVALYQEPSK